MDASSPDFKKKLLLAIAVACGLLAVVLIFALVNSMKEQNVKQIEAIKHEMQSQAQASRQVLVPVLVAAREIRQGAVIGAVDLAAREIPRDYATPGAISTNVNIIGLTALSTIAAGEQILQSKVGQPEKPKLLSALTPPGKRAVTVVVENMSNLAGMLQSGDYVDVLASITPPENSPLAALASQQGGKLVTLPLFQNVLILGIGGAKDNSVMLALSPQEASLVAFVQEQGKIRLMTKSSMDTKADSQVKPVNWDSLFEYLYPDSKDRMKPATVEIYRGLQKSTVSLPMEGHSK
jgi:pilus assembly protein CpaB